MPNTVTTHEKSKQTDAKQKHPKYPHWLTWLLVIADIGVVLFLVSPYLPNIGFWITQQPIVRQISHTDQREKDAEQQAMNNPSDTNRLVIPRLGVTAPIVEGDTVDVLIRTHGVWRDPGTKNPTLAGNMVLAGHRFQFIPWENNYFYNLPTLIAGDVIIVNWQRHAYRYEVDHTETVEPKQVDIRNDTPGVPHQLTLYTCTPLGSSAKRFVVSAHMTS